MSLHRAVLRRKGSGQPVAQSAGMKLGELSVAKQSPPPAAPVAAFESGLLEPICRGLVGYVSYLATCNTSTVYSEYLLYEPLLRIAQSKGYATRCEYEVSKGAKGDAKRIDFLVSKDGKSVGVEVKWLRSDSAAIANDSSKLATLYAEGKVLAGYVLLFGRASRVKCAMEKLKKRRLITADKCHRVIEWRSGHTSYGASFLKVA